MYNAHFFVYKTQLIIAPTSSELISNCFYLECSCSVFYLHQCESVQFSLLWPRTDRLNTALYSKQEK